MRTSIALILFAIGALSIGGCTGASTTEEFRGAPPPVVQPDPGMKAPEDRPGMKKDGGAAGAG